MSGPSGELWRVQTGIGLNFVSVENWTPRNVALYLSIVSAFRLPTNILCYDLNTELEAVIVMSALALLSLFFFKFNILSFLFRK